MFISFHVEGLWSSGKNTLSTFQVLFYAHPFLESMEILLVFVQSDPLHGKKVTVEVEFFKIITLMLLQM